MDKQSLAEQLNEVQLNAVQSIEGPNLVLAGAGSGKTRVLTFKIAWALNSQEVRPSEILAVTFTNKAAAEMKTRIQTLLGERVNFSMMGTFHSVCARILRSYGQRLGFTSSFTIYDKDDQKRFLKKLLLTEGETAITPEILRHQISRYKNRYHSPEVASRQAEDLDEERLVLLYRRYQEELKKNNAMDFDDLIYQTISLLEQHADIRESFQKRIKYVFIDEFQDTNRAQFLLIQALLGQGRNITVVGDDDQSIYGWRGADITNILSFQKLYPGANVYKLEQNYRSTSNIIGLASSVILNNRQRMEKKLWTANAPGKKVFLKRNDNENEDAEWIVSHIKKDAEYDYGQISIFYRTHAQSRVLEDSMRRHRIPYVIFGGIRFYDRKETKDIVAYLRVLCNSADSVSLGRVINVPKRGIGTKTVEFFADLAINNSVTLYDALFLNEYNNADNSTQFKKIKPVAQLFADLKSKLEELSLPDLVSAVIQDSGYGKSLEAEGTDEALERLANIEELVAAAQDFEDRNQSSDLGEFLQEISLLTDIDQAKEGFQAVTLMTIHSSKGLEFPKVYLTGLEQGLFPLIRFGKEDQLEEERRLFYVAVTRARQELILTHCVERRLWGNWESLDPSKFLLEADAAYINDLDGRGKHGVRKIANNAPSATVDVFPDYENTSQELEYYIGQRILHQKFGEGFIRKTEGRGESARITTQFEDGVMRTLVLKFAKIKVLD